jgi:glutamine synthetase
MGTAREDKAKRVRAVFCDLMNLPRGKYVPSSLADGGSIGFARGAFAVSYDRELLSVPGTGYYEGLPDMDMVLDEERRTAWQPHTEIALGRLEVDGKPFDLCPRSLLMKTVDNWKQSGLTPMVGLELEAFVFQRDADGVWRPYDTPGAFVYGTGPENDPAGLVDMIWKTADKCGLPVESMNGEYDNGQFEMTLCFDNALKACDDAMLFRMMARELAYRSGYLLTFMPKPMPERGGSGLHVNFSFKDQDGANVIAPDGELSDLATHCIGGLLRHHESMAALLAPTVNSYARLTPASLSGYWANWGEDHRLTTIRSSSKSPKSARLEHRMSDGGANPYIAVATVLEAARLGVVDKLAPGKPEDLDGIEHVRAERHTPPTLTRALDSLEKDRRLIEALNPLLVEAFLVLKRDEAKRLKNGHIDQIRDFYLPFI